MSDIQLISHLQQSSFSSHAQQYLLIKLIYVGHFIVAVRTSKVFSIVQLINVRHLQCLTQARIIHFSYHIHNS